MTPEPQEYEDDPIIAALGISQELQPVVPPIDVVCGHFQNKTHTFRLHHKHFGMYMEVDLGRILHKEKAPKCGTRLYLRADGNYEDEVNIGFTVLPGQEGMGPVEPTHMALYRTATYPKTTPWHE